MGENFEAGGKETIFNTEKPTNALPPKGPTGWKRKAMHGLFDAAVFLSIDGGMEGGMRAGEFEEAKTDAVATDTRPIKKSESANMPTELKQETEKKKSVDKEFSAEEIKELGRSGKKLPMLLQKAADLAKVDSRLVVYVEDSEKLFKKTGFHSLDKEDNNHASIIGFRIKGIKLIFLNGTNKNVSDIIDGAAANPQVALNGKYVYFFSAIVKHENAHLNGADEAEALSVELKLLQDFKDSGKLGDDLNARMAAIKRDIRSLESSKIASADRIKQ